jgi:hypothetical protein
VTLQGSGQRFERMRFPCPLCACEEVVVASRRMTIIGLFCTHCEHAWTREDRRHRSDRRRRNEAIPADRRLAPDPRRRSSPAPG